MSPDKQTPRRSKYVSGNGAPSDGGDTAAGGEDDSEDRLSKLMDEKLTNNGTIKETLYFLVF